MNFYLVTDTHYFEPSLGASGKAFEEYMQREQYFMAESSDIVKAVFERISEDKETELVLIPGDLSKNGEIESHKSFVKELYKLKESGKRVYVLTAGHDYNEYSRAFVNDERIDVEGTPFKELRNIYNDFGYSEALAVDDQTLSYIVEIEKGIRLLAINCDADGSPKGTVDERLEAWIKAQLDIAVNDGCSVIAMCHYPVIPSVPVFDLVGDAKLKNWRRTASVRADYGVKLVLTGHMHIQSINEFVSENGNKLIDICTSCLVGSPAKYRKIEIDGDNLHVESIDVHECGADTGDLTTQEYFDNQFKYSITNRINGALNGGKGIAKLLKKCGKKLLNTITLGGLGRLLWIKVDKSIKKEKFIDFAADLGVKIFAGDMPYVEGTPQYDAVARVLKRFGFIIRKIEPKLSKNGVKVNLTEMLLGTIGNSKGWSDNNTDLKIC